MRVWDEDGTLIEDTDMVMEHSGEISFEDMLVLRCKYCKKELTWHTMIPGPKEVLYVASCCGVGFQAKIHTVSVDVEDTGIVVTNVCVCGHDKAEHSRDKGCSHHRDDNEFKDVCECWRFRARKQGEEGK